MRPESWEKSSTFGSSTTNCWARALCQWISWKNELRNGWRTRNSTATPRDRPPEVVASDLSRRKFLALNLFGPHKIMEPIYRFDLVVPSDALDGNRHVNNV